MATDQHDTVTQTLPQPGAGPLMQSVPVLSIARSLTNQRKHFDPAKLQELAESIKATGVLQPILVRPLPVSRVKDEMTQARAEKREPAQYELVCGERRWRASQLAEVPEIPAVIRPLTDAQALKAQVIENLQRADITELEEAEGYEKLMESQNINADQLGAEVGKSRSYIYGRLKLLDLCEQAREALREGKIDHSVALPIARIPSEQLQLKALQYATQTNYYGSTPGAREVSAHVRNNYMLKLKEAPFDRKDAELCPKAGACTDCSKRTGAEPDLFTDVDSADVCTDPPCFHNKEELHAARVRQAAEDQGLDVIDGREAKALMPSAYSGEISGYLRLDTDKDIPIKGKPLRKIIGKAMERSGIKPTMIVNPHDPKELIAVLRPEQAQELLQAAGAKEHQDKLQEQTEREEKELKREQAQKEQQAYEVKWRKDLAKDLIHKVALQAVSWEAIPRTLLESLCKQQINALDAESIRQLCDVLELGKVAPQQALIDWAMDHDYADVALMQLMVWKDRTHRTWVRDSENAVLMCIAAECGVDVTAFQNQIKANQRAAKATKKQQEAKKAALSTLSDDSLKPQEAASTPTPAAQAQKGRGGKKGAKAQVSETPKTSEGFARAQIAEAMQAAESPAGAAESTGDGQEDISGAAAAAQDDDAQAVAVAQPATAPSPTAAWPFPTTKPPADTHAASGEQLTVGTWVIVNNTHSNKKLRGERGQVYSKVRDDYLINIPDRSPFSSTREHLTPCEPPAAAASPADPDVFKEGAKVRIKADADIAPKYDRLRGQEGELRYSVGAKQNVWRVAFPGVIKRGLPDVQSFNIKDLEIVQ
ncbi:ParB/RepB/Spo0J family partition protein [Comamonas odontotermitis]|uniref:ParB/RepB/Spo0J family partition protein n=1 Tax=Comamonas odontotermitis TaxID=379895 RepID=UPI003753223F